MLAAAIASGAAVIVTFNLTDFPDHALAEYGVAALHPDAFLSALLDAAPCRFTEVVDELLDALRNPPLTLQQYGEVLRRQGLPRLVQRLLEPAPK